MMRITGTFSISLKKEMIYYSKLLDRSRVPLLHKTISTVLTSKIISVLLKDKIYYLRKEILTRGILNFTN
jgi:hypothetical protein